MGNFPGVTVERAESELKRRKDVILTDLPGIYSLSPYSAEETVTRDFLISGKPDAIINIVDGMNIERNLYLTLQVLEMGIPTVIALNMIDEMRKNRRYADISSLSRSLGVLVVPISALGGEGTDELADIAVRLASEHKTPERTGFYSGGLHNCIRLVSGIVSEKAKERNIPLSFAASKLVEGDGLMENSLGLSENERQSVSGIVKETEKRLGTDREAMLADARYAFIGSVCEKSVVRHGESAGARRSDRIDSVVTNRFLSVPINLLIMASVFVLTFGTAGKYLSALLSRGIDALTLAADGVLTRWDVNTAVHSLVTDGVFRGVGSVLSFLPAVLVLFTCLSVLEDSGYMARLAFVTDAFLRKIGLSGCSFAPVLMGFGCSVPAIMATRTIASERDRIMTVMLIPFVSCGAKMPVYAVVAAAVFPANVMPVVAALCTLGVLLGVLSSVLLKSTLFRGNSVPFIMEMPPYRFPSPRNVAHRMLQRTKDFLEKAFTTVFLASIAVWFLRSFDMRLMYTSEPSRSLLAAIGRNLEFIFSPLGFGDWRIVTSLVSGITAKENIVGTLGVLFGAGEDTLATVLGAAFPTAASGLSFLVFVMLYMPCIAAVNAIRRELGAKAALGIVVYQTLTAYAVSFAVYSAASLM